MYFSWLYCCVLDLGRWKKGVIRPGSHTINKATDWHVSDVKKQVLSLAQWPWLCNCSLLLKPDHPRVYIFTHFSGNVNSHIHTNITSAFLKTPVSFNSFYGLELQPARDIYNLWMWEIIGVHQWLALQFWKSSVLKSWLPFYIIFTL